MQSTGLAKQHPKPHTPPLPAGNNHHTQISRMLSTQTLSVGSLKKNLFQQWQSKTVFQPVIPQLKGMNTVQDLIKALMIPITIQTPIVKAVSRPAMYLLMDTITAPATKQTQIVTVKAPKTLSYTTQRLTNRFQPAILMDQDGRCSTQSGFLTTPTLPTTTQPSTSPSIAVPEARTKDGF